MKERLKRKTLSHRYSDTISHTRVALLGICPPPFGGVSVHVERVMRKLREQDNIVHFFSTEPRGRYKLFPLYLLALVSWLFFKKPKTVIYHSVYLKNSTPELWLLSILKSWLGHELIIVEHNCRHMYQRSARFKEKMNVLLAHADHLVFIGDQVFKSYQENGIRFYSFSIESAFVPPDLEQKKEIMSTYPSSLFTFLKNHTPLILVNASQPIELDSHDLYGVNSTFYVIQTLKNEFPHIGLIFATTYDKREYVQNIQNYLSVLGIENNVYVLAQQQELWPLFEHVDLFVRPTLKDGPGISVHEARHFDIPVVASDVSLRAEGTILFKAGNVHDFVKKVRNVLHKNYRSAHVQRDRVHA